MEGALRKAFILWSVLTLCAHVPVSEGSSFLLVPIPMGSSHCLEMMGVGRALQERGHTVHLLLPEFAEVHKCVAPDLRAAINVIFFPLDPELWHWFTSNTGTYSASVASGQGSNLLLFQTLAATSSRYCHMYSYARPFLDKFIAAREDSNHRPLDMVLLDANPFTQCLTLIPEYLHTPFAFVGSHLWYPVSSTPWPVTYYPLPILVLPGKLNFGQRVVNTIAFGVIELLVRVINSQYEPGDDFGESLAQFDYCAAAKKAELFLENSDYLVDYAKATFPNFVQVGGLTTGPARPMADALQKHFDSCRQGVVIVSFGSILFNASRDMADKLLSAAARVKINVVLRLNVTSATVKVPKHVKPVSWFPQNDALGHVNTKIFVSHCGKNSFFESLYHAVPILCSTFNADGVGTGSRVTEFGVGASVDLNTITAEELGDTINSMVADQTMRERMTFFSTLFHQRPETPGHRAASALEHVIQHGGHHLRPQSVELSFVQYTGLDVCCTLLLLALLLLGLTVAVWGSILRCCVRRLRKTSAGGVDKGAKQQ